tara:strand:+ start:1284 stop:1946 length:663 start_codon:yes stop_codon:yes gene_type:complete
LYTVQSFKTFNYIPAVTKGWWESGRIGDVSDDYKVAATPSKETFGKVWRKIYGRLFLFNFVLPWFNDEYEKNMKLQRKWIDDWINLDFTSANTHLIDLVNSTKRLRLDYIEDKDEEDLGESDNYYCEDGGSFTLKTLDMYETWVQIAYTLNKNIVSKYYTAGETAGEDKSLQEMGDLLNTLDKKKIHCEGVSDVVKLYEEGLLLENRDKHIDSLFNRTSI